MVDEGAKCVARESLKCAEDSVAPSVDTGVRVGSGLVPAAAVVRAAADRPGIVSVGADVERVALPEEPLLASIGSKPGGEVRWWRDWVVDDASLKAIRYRYTLPSNGIAWSSKNQSFWFGTIAANSSEI